MELTIRAISAILSIAGSVLLAWRVKGILEALGLVANAHEVNLHQIVSGSTTVHFVTGATEHVKKAQKFGLLIAGFGCLILSGILQLVALFVA